MGCGSSKGHAKKNDIKFDSTYCLSVDRFFDKAQDTIKDFKELAEGLSKKKEDYFESSGFLYVPCASKFSSYN
jgi:hypothetical protein